MWSTRRVSPLLARWKQNTISTSSSLTIARRSRRARRVRAVWAHKSWAVASYPGRFCSYSVSRNFNSNIYKIPQCVPGFTRRGFNPDWVNMSCFLCRMSWSQEKCENKTEDRLYHQALDIPPHWGTKQRQFSGTSIFNNDSLVFIMHDKKSTRPPLAVNFCSVLWRWLCAENKQEPDLCSVFSRHYQDHLSRRKGYSCILLLLLLLLFEDVNSCYSQTSEQCSEKSIWCDKNMFFIKCHRSKLDLAFQPISSVCGWHQVHLDLPLAFDLHQCPPR